jgi:N,N'-diacetyllegionaminate synthase
MQIAGTPLVNDLKPFEQLSNMDVLFLIPARAGSKGVPEKNVKTVGGIPLVGRAARVAREACRRVGGKGRVICSTDGSEIAEAARHWGAEVPFLRPASLASDSARTIDVVFHALDCLGEDFDTVVLIQPTSPLVEGRDVVGALEAYRRTGSPVVSVCENEHPVEWFFRMDDSGKLMPILASEATHQRQGFSSSYRLNGGVYVAPVSVLRDRESFLTAETRGFVMPADRSVDVDTEFDLLRAESIIESRELPVIDIAGREVGPGRPCFIIAEAGVNHNGDLELAQRLIDAAVAAGTDAIKFQTFKAELLTTPEAPKASYQKETTGSGESQLKMIKRLEFPQEVFGDLKLYAERRGVMFLSTPFDRESADYLDSIGMPAIKVPSGEITNHRFLAHVSGKGKPLIVSTGMSSLEEVDEAMSVIRGAGDPPVVLLHCVSNYPAAAADVNLRAMQTMARAFQVPVGYSDHVLGNEAAFAAAALGACVIEKHFTLDRSLPGPDHRASLEPNELSALVRGIRAVESALGDGCKRPAASETDTAAAARKSLVAARDIAAGTVLSEEMIAVKRPGTGIPPSMLERVLNRRLCRDVVKDSLLTLDDLA